MKLDSVKPAVDAISVSVTVGAILQALPHIAAAFTVLWAIFRAYEAWLSIKERRLRIQKLGNGYGE